MPRKSSQGQLPLRPFVVRHTRIIGIALLLVAAAALALVWRSSPRRTASAPQVIPAAAAASKYVGSRDCEACHPGESRAWRGSQHAQAMAEATGSAVLGRFDGRQFTYAGITSSFFQRDGTSYVRTEGADGRLADFEIKYTFGVYPLQQYLVAFPRGRLQALSLAWDTRPVTAGGQRWFHLYPDERIRAGDPLHWTGPQQNWNFMCADCHSTNVRKGYDPATRQYATTWSEVSVGCEACHGPGEAHVAWARRGGVAVDARRYLTARFDERKGIVWGIDPVSQLPVRSKPRGSDGEIEACARCHARRAQMTDAIKAGDRFEDGFRASLLEPSLFHADGQQRDEVYTYASFLQSRMYAKGVTCSDCHDPHTGKLRLPGNTLCTQCHLPAKYDTPAHHRHAAGSSASACVVCHMPAKTYMGVDPRRDHSFRIPRPDLAVTLDVPDVCTTACHRGRTPAWAAAALERQYGHAPAPAPTRHFGEVFHAADEGAPDRAIGLQRLASDDGLPAIVRASALERIATDGGIADSGVAARALLDPSALVRRAALAALQSAGAATRLRLVPPLLSDSARTVRVQALMSLVDVSGTALPGTFRAAFDRALDDYLSEQRFNADRPEAQTNVGTTLAAIGQIAGSIAAFREAVALDRTFVPAYVNLADVHRSQGNEAEAERVLREAIAVMAAAADAHHALGLSLVRQRRIPEALAALAESVRRAPDSARYAYVYAVALHDTGSAERAVAVLSASLARHPRDRDTLSLLASYAMERGRLSDARTYATRLLALEPDAADARALLQQLQVGPSSRPGGPQIR